MFNHEKGRILNVVSVENSSPIRKEFWGNTLFQGYIPDNSSIIVVDGAAVITAELGRDIDIITQWSVGTRQRGALKIYARNHGGGFEPAADPEADFGPPFKMTFGDFYRVVKPLDIVVCSEPVDPSEDEKMFELPGGFLCSIRSRGDLIFVHDTPQRLTATTDGEVICLGSLGTLSVINSYSQRGVNIQHIGDFCSVSTSGKIRAGSTGKAVALSAAKGSEIGPLRRLKRVFGDYSVATVSGTFRVFGSLRNRKGIAADNIVVCREGPDYCLMKKRRGPKAKGVVFAPL
jgi:hypothetical protein